MDWIYGINDLLAFRLAVLGGIIIVGLIISRVTREQRIPGSLWKYEWADWKYLVLGTIGKLLMVPEIILLTEPSIGWLGWVTGIGWIIDDIISKINGKKIKFWVDSYKVVITVLSQIWVFIVFPCCLWIWMFGLFWIISESKDSEKTGIKISLGNMVFWIEVITFTCVWIATLMGVVVI